jgi:hypothetical protein
MRRCLFATLPLLFAATLGSSTAAQPDKSLALTQAKTKFEGDIAKAEEALLAGMEKALAKAQAANNKPMVEKLTYERNMFTLQRLVPTAVPTTAYLKQRTQATAALEAVYNPEIKRLKAKKDAGADELETTLNDLVKASRGYGLAFPDLETRPVFVIENKATGQVIETENKEGTGNLVLGPKVGRKKANQCWQLEREEKGYLIRNVASRQGFHVPYAGSDPGAILVTWPTHEQSKEVNKGSLFRVVEGRREVALGAAWNALVLTSTEKQVKGVTTYFVTQEKEKNETPPSDKQRWIFTEAK